MLLHAFVPASRANGPGLRAVVFFQGCLLHCPGCWNPTTHRFRGPDVQVSEIAGRILAARRQEAIEGVTFSGGEPMHQADALVELMARLRTDCVRLSFGMFSGHTEGELAIGDYFVRGIANRRRKAGLWREVQALLDFAVLGRYDRALPTRVPLRSSRNQRLVLLSDRYTETDFAPQSIEVSIGADGAAVVTGFPVMGMPA